MLDAVAGLLIRDFAEDDPRAALPCSSIRDRARTRSCRGPCDSPGECRGGRQSRRRSENPGPGRSPSARRSTRPACRSRPPPRRRFRPDCAAECSSPCPPRCPANRSPANSGTSTAAPSARCPARRRSGTKSTVSSFRSSSISAAIRRHTGFRIPHRRRRQPGDRPKVPLLVHQHVADVPLLRHPHQRRIDHALAVRVVVAARVAGNLRAFHAARPSAKDSGRSSRPESAAATASAVANVGQCPADDHAHRVRQIAILKLLLDRQLDQPAAAFPPARPVWRRRQDRASVRSGGRIVVGQVRILSLAIRDWGPPS